MGITPIANIGGKEAGLFGYGGTVGPNTFSDLGGAVGDLFRGFGDRVEAKNYRLAAGLADQNAQFTQMSTDIKEMQATRAITMGMGQTQADVAGAGFAQSGSALDLLRDSASQGALTKAVLSEQGLITEAGYKEQAESYRNMASYAETAEVGDFLGGVLKGDAGIGIIA